MKILYPSGYSFFFLFSLENLLIISMLISWGMVLFLLKIMSLSSALLRLFLRIRYRVNITWLELMDWDWSKLILPSHVALIDPVIISAFLWKKKWLSPVVTEDYYKVPVLKWVFDCIWAIPIPDLTWNKAKTLNTNLIVWNITKALENGRNILLYPQWALARQWFQSIVWKKTAFYVAEQLPKNTKILTVSIRWLRWSRSSWAWTWKAPNLPLFALKGLLFTIFDLIFFVPKRKVEVEIKDSTTLLQKICKKWVDAFNQELEKIYNAKWEEKLNYLSGLFWYNTTKHKKEPDVIQWSIKDLKRTAFSWNADIPEDVLKKVTAIIKKINEKYHLILT